MCATASWSHRIRVVRAVLRLRPGRLVAALGLAAGTATLLWTVRDLAPGLAGAAWLALVTASALGAVLLSRVIFFLGRQLAKKLLWRVRHRMVAVFLLVGFLPVSLGALIVAWGLLLLFGPLAAHTVSTDFLRQAERVAAVAKPLLWQLEDLPPAERLAFAKRFHERASRSMPGLLLDVRLEGLEASIPEEAWRGLERPADPPAGEVLLRRGDTLFLAAIAREASGPGRVLALVPGRTEDLTATNPSLRLREVDPRADPPVAEGSDLPPAANALDWLVRWPIQAQFTDWASGDTVRATYLLQTRPFALWRRIFGQETDLTMGIFTFLGIGLVATFALNLLLSLFVATSITRTMTRAVNDLYVGTRRVNRGDFSHRIPIAGSDQISDLSRSFNTMTASLEGLIEESKQRQQLEAELEIAREVQARLFPSTVPAVEGIQVLGVCRPARVVSGDFYDYLEPREGLLAVTFGDVSGKGISAALVMASLHSAIRAHLGEVARAGAQGLGPAIERIVGRVNAHMFESTASNKFSTLLFAAYDAAEGTLVYCNAGHLPPLLVRDGEVRALEVTGMVLGALEGVGFGAAQVTLEPGDLLALYTDGLTEPEDPSGQEFGETRLQEALLRRSSQPPAAIVEGVMDDVLQWTGAKTLYDDMTMLVVRRT